MKVLITSFIVLIGLTTYCQSNFSSYRTQGMGSNMMMGTGDEVMLNNTSILGYQAFHSDREIEMNFYDFNGQLSSPLFNYGLNQLWGQVFNGVSSDEISNNYLMSFEEMFYTGAYGGVTYDTTISRGVRQETKERLMQVNTVNSSRTYVGFTFYNPDKNRVFTMKSAKYGQTTIQFGENLADLWVYGKTASYFDTLVLMNGTHLANQSANYTNDILSQINYSFSNSPLTIGEQLNGTHIESVSYIAQSFGFSQKLNQIESKNWQVYYGLNASLLKGLDYLLVDGDNNTVEYFDSYKNNYVDFAGGWGAMFGGSLTFQYKKKLLLSTSISQVGGILWKVKPNQKGYGVSYNSSKNGNLFNYTYGAFADKPFNVQWDEVGFELEDNDSTLSVYKQMQANFHLGAKWEINEHIAFGASVKNGMNKDGMGGYDHAQYNLSTQINLGRFSFFTGVYNFDKTRTAIPFGLSVNNIFQGLELGLSMADLNSLFKSETESIYSIGFGLKYVVNR